MDSSVTVRARTPAYCFGTWADVLINSWGGGGDLAALQLLKDVTARFYEERQAPFCSVTVISPQGQIKVPPEVRKASAEHSKLIAPWVKASAFVIEGEGARVAATRLMLTGISMVAAPPYEQKICRNVEEAGRWLEAWGPGLKAAGGAAGLVAAVAQLRPG